MKLCTFSFVVWSTCCTYMFFGICQEIRPNFKILAPQFICNDDATKNGANVTAMEEPPKAINIRFHTAVGQHLSFNWSVRFQIINSPRGQRFNLMVWRAVRSLEKYLTSMSDSIVENNMIAINNSMLIQGVDYVFHITGKNKQGVLSEPKTFAIKYTDSKSDPKLDLDGGGENEQFSVVMLGSEVIYSDVTYVVEAQVTPCKPTNDYYFVWTVTTTDGVMIDIGEQKGKRLKIPQGTLIGGKEYDIVCKIIKISEQRQITSNGLFLQTLMKGLSIAMNVDKMTIAKKTSITISATLNNPDNLQGKITYMWKCIIITKSIDCPNFKTQDQNEITLEGGFHDEGEYEIGVTIEIANKQVSSKAKIIVQNAMLPTIEIASTPKLVATKEAFEVQAKVFELRSNCVLFWKSVKENGYEYLEKSLVPGNLGGDATINSHDETFLSELVEFDNTTISRDFPLKIPSSMENIWDGLKPNVKYKFRLSVNCSCSANLECFGPNNITAFSDVVIETNAPPQLKDLKVSPSSGLALKTIFQFSTTPAVDSKEDYPLTYIFGIKFSTDSMILAMFVENLAMETILPFSDLPYVSFLRACDSRGACATKEGPVISVSNDVQITESDLNSYLDDFKINVFRKDYNYGFNMITMVCQTIKLTNKQMYDSFMNIVEEIIKENIAKQIVEVKKATNYITYNEFIETANRFIEKFQVSDALIQDILNLRDEVFNLISPTSTNEELKRNKRSNNRQKREITPDSLYNYIKMSENVIINSGNQDSIRKEKDNSLITLEKSAIDFCKKKSYTTLDWKLISTNVDAVVIKQNMGFLWIPYTPQNGNKIHAKIQLTVGEDFSPSSYCLMKTIFRINYINDDNDEDRTGPIYYCSVYGKSSKVENFPIILQLPIEGLETKKMLQCRRWNNKKWDPETCTTNENYIKISNINYVVCKCDSLGYFSLYSVENPTITQILTSSSVTSSQSFSTIHNVRTTSEITTENYDNQGNQIVDGEKLDNIKRKASKGNIIAIITTTVLILLSVIFVILFYVKSMKKRRIKKQLLMKKENYEIPKYNKFFDEHLMEGSMESLGKYNIIDNN